MPPETKPLNQNGEMNLHHKVSHTFAISVMVLVATIAGYLVWAQNQQAWPFDDVYIRYPDSINDRSPSTSLGTNGEYASWKTYRNEEYGFEFKYPKPEYSSELNYAELLKEGVSIMQHTEYDVEYISIFPVTNRSGNHGQLDIFPAGVSHLDHSKWVETGDYTVKEVMMGGKRAIAYEKINQNLLGTHKEIRLLDIPPNWDDTNQISYRLYDNSNKESIVLFDKIVSTIKFVKPLTLDEIDVSEWSTYRNTKYHYEFKYPEDLKQTTEIGIRTGLNDPTADRLHLSSDNGYSLYVEGCKMEIKFGSLRAEKILSTFKANDAECPEPPAPQY